MESFSDATDSAYFCAAMYQLCYHQGKVSDGDEWLRRADSIVKQIPTKSDQLSAWFTIAEAEIAVADKKRISNAVSAISRLTQQVIKEMPKNAGREVSVMEYLCGLYRIERESGYHQHLDGRFADLIASLRLEEDSNLHHLACVLALHKFGNMREVNRVNNLYAYALQVERNQQNSKPEAIRYYSEDAIHQAYAYNLVRAGEWDDLRRWLTGIERQDLRAKVYKQIASALSDHTQQ